MKFRNAVAGTIGLCTVLVAMLAIGTPSSSAQDKPDTSQKEQKEKPKKVRERFKAVAVNRGALTAPAMGRFDIVIDRWSTDADSNRLFAALKSKGQEEMVDTLIRLPRAGFIGFGGDLYYAQKTTSPQGVDQIRVIMDRDRTPYEMVNKPKTWEYPFIVIDFEVNPDGAGKGTMTIATKAMTDPDGKFVVMENYDTQSILLDVRREKP